MGLEMDLDLGGMSGDDVEKGGNLNQPGWYRANVYDVSEDLKTPGMLVWVFEVTHGPHTGSKVYDRLYPPDLAKDEKSAEAALRRLRLYAKRLGLWDGVPRPGQLRIDWAAAIGAPVVLHVKRDVFKDKDTESLRESFKLEFDGIFPPNHAKIPPDVRKALGLPNPPAAGSDGAAGAAVPAPNGGPSPAAPATPARAPGGAGKRNYGAL